MGRQPCCDKVGLKRGPWTIEEDHKLTCFILTNGIHCWRVVPKLAGLLRCGKSCRLRWINYLRPDLKRGDFTEMEEDQIIELHSRLGNRWSKIASHLPGRTDNEIKNHWNTRIKKRLKQLGVDPATHKPIEHHEAETGSTPSHDKESSERVELVPVTESLVIDHVRNDHLNVEENQEQDGEDILKEYEMLCGSLDLSPPPNEASSTSYSSSSWSVDESIIDPSLWDSPSIIREDSLRQWVDSTDSVLSWDGFNNLDDDLFFLGDGFHDMQQFSVPEFF